MYEPTIRCSSVPMLYIRRCIYYITTFYKTFRLAFFLIKSFSIQYQQYLICVRMDMPRIVTTRLEYEMMNIIFRF